MISFSNLKLGQRLLLSLAITALSVVLILAVGYLVAERAVSQLTHIHDQINAKTVVGVDLSNAYSIDLTGLVDKLVSGAYPWEVGPDRLEKIKDNIESDMDRLHQPPLDANETDLIQDIEDKDVSVDDLINQLRPVLRNRDTKALRHLSRRLHPCVDPLGFRIQRFLQYELERSKVLVQANEYSFHWRYGLVICLDVIFFFPLLLLVSKHLRQTVSRPLGQLVDQMKHIAQGDADLKSRLEVEGKDEIGEVAMAFNDFVGKLQSVEDMKLDLISVTSHQLKTPVAEINGFIENILDGLTGEISPRLKRYLEEMRSIGRDNYSLICDLLSVSKIDRGVETLDLKTVSAKEVISLAIRDYEAAMRRKCLEFHLEGTEGEVRFRADRDKTVESLRNLLNNAIKCTDKGSITVRVGQEQDRGFIEVADTGIGMDVETLGRLFTKGRMMGLEAHRSGAGLGLYITKSFMKLQHGDVTVTSEKGKGSRFKLWIPLCHEMEGAVT